MAELPTHVLLHRIAGFGLPRGGDGSAAPFPGPLTVEPLVPERWNELLAAAHGERLVGLLQAAVEADALPVTPRQRDELGDLHTIRCASVLSLERALLAADDLLSGAGIDVVVLKGTAHAHLLYPDPAWRTFGDNDLLLRADQFETAVRLLQDVGYERPVPQARPGFDARFGKGATLRRPNRDELDLHRTLLFGTFGLRIDLGELFGSTVPFSVGGRTLRALGPDERVLHLCYHAALGDARPKLSSIRDLAQAITASGTDPTQVIWLARAWESEAVVARGVRLCRSHLGFDVGGPLSELALRYRPTRREDRAIASYVGEDRGFARKVLASLAYLDGPAAKLALLRAALVPSAAFRASVGSGGAASWLRRGLRGITHGRRRP